MTGVVEPGGQHHRGDVGPLQLGPLGDLLRRRRGVPAPLEAVEDERLVSVRLPEEVEDVLGGQLDDPLVVLALRPRPFLERDRCRRCRQSSVSGGDTGGKKPGDLQRVTGQLFHGQH